MARRYHSPAIAYTYTDPVVYYEYTRDCSIAARAAGIKNILVTAGYINRQPFRELCRNIDAANIDLKAYSDKFYREICGGTLKHVLDSLVIAKEMNIELEITNLIIPGLNDQDEMINSMVRWIADNLGKDTPLHFSRFVPRYRMRNLPPTSDETLGNARNIAIAAGLLHVYTGNLLKEDWMNTFCPGCRLELIRREGYVITGNILKNSCCPKCGYKIYGVWQ
jgi:pyruvate formate lyase activating enzyme